MDLSTIARPRVGHIRFLNCAPIYAGLVRTGAILDMELVRATPDELNDSLVAGRLDISAISLVEYLRHADELLLLPGIAIGSDGPVLSVDLISSRPPGELDGRPVALGSTSRTSVLLAQMWLADAHDARPDYFTAAPDLDAMMAQADAAVVIGDAALAATLEAPAKGWTVHDLGAAWRDWTGLPMVFAVWAVRRDYAAAHPEVVAEVSEALGRARDLGVQAADEVAAQAARWEQFDQPTLAHYFRTLDYALGPEQVTSITEYSKRAAAVGALAAPVVPEFVEVPLATVTPVHRV